MTRIPDGPADTRMMGIVHEAVDDGTRITQSFRIVRAPALLAAVYATIVPTHRDRNTGLTDDLRRLGELAAEDVQNDQAPMQSHARTNTA